MGNLLSGSLNLIFLPCGNSIIVIMKKIIPYFFGFLLLSCAARKHDAVSYAYFKHYTKSQLDTISQNWSSYTFNDLSKLDTIDQVPIRYDSYGHMYPDLAIFDGLDPLTFMNKYKGDFLWRAKKRADRELEKYSLFTLFTYERNFDILRNKINKLQDPKSIDFYRKMVDSKLSRELFYEEWDNFHVKRKISEIKMVMTNKNKRKVFFFIHGYNVPYSLAHVQATSLIKEIDTLKIDVTDILLIPIYWPSNHAKRNKIYKSHRFNISNRKTIDAGLKFK